MEYYPIFIDLHDKQVLVTGHYRVLEFKIKKLLEAGARVRYVSKTLQGNFADLVQRKLIEHIDSGFDEQLLDDVWLVICGSDDPRLKEHIRRAANRRHILTNFVDDTPLCSFIAPAVIDRGDITIAVSTSGKSPALCKTLKARINEYLGREYQLLADLLGKIRPQIIAGLPDQQQRSKLFDRIVQDEQVLRFINKNNIAAAEERISEMIRKELQHS